MKVEYGRLLKDELIQTKAENSLPNCSAANESR